MTLVHKHIKAGDFKAFDTAMAYVMVMQCSGCSYETNSLMAHELSPVPTSMFDASGHKTRSCLKNSLKVQYQEGTQTLKYFCWMDVQFYGYSHGQ